MTWVPKFTLLCGQKENFHSCIIVKDEKKRVMKVRFFRDIFSEYITKSFATVYLHLL